jgi:hypothetical protein
MGTINKGQSRDTSNIGYTWIVLFLIVAMVFSNVYLSCVAYVTSFSGLSILIAPSRRGNQKGQSRETDKYTLENTEGAIKKDNPEKLTNKR